MSQVKADTEKKRLPFEPKVLELPSTPEGKARLLGSRCRSCGECQLGKRRFCIQCFSKDLEEIDLSQRGKVTRYSIVYVPTSAWKGESPYVVGSVETPEGVLVEAPIVECDFGSLKVGMEVEMVVRKADENAEGNEIMAYAWRPC